MTKSRMTKRCRAGSLLLLACLSACGHGPQQESHGPAVELEPASNPDRVSIPAIVRKNLGIRFAEVEVRDVAGTIRMPGAFELRPLARHDYRIALPGKIEIQVDQYEAVEVGQLLFRYQSPMWPELLHEVISGEQDMASAQAEIEVSRAKIEESRRKLELARTRIERLAQADFKKADLEAEAAELEAAVPRLEAELRLADIRLTNAGRTREHALHRAAAAAEISEGELEREVIVAGKAVPAYTTIDWIEVRAVEVGVVELLSVTDGSFLEPSTSVLTTVDPEQVRFRAMALQADLTRLLGSISARIVPPRSPGIPIEAGVPALMTLGLEAHPEERTMSWLATPEAGASWIRPGVSAFLEVVIESNREPALAIPRSAIVQAGLTHVFFRRDPQDPDVAIRTQADMGPSDGRWVVLESGVMLGDEVVLDGVYELELSTARAGVSQKGGHMHADGSFHDEH